MSLACAATLRHDEAGGAGAGGGDERAEAELLDGDAKLGELRLVYADDVVVRLGDARELVLQVLDGAVLGVEHVVELLGDGAEEVGVEVGGVDDLGQLRLLLLERLVDRLQLALEQDVLEAALLLHVVDGRLELLIQVVALLTTHTTQRRWAAARFGWAARGCAARAFSTW